MATNVGISTDHFIPPLQRFFMRLDAGRSLVVHQSRVGKSITIAKRGTVGCGAPTVPHASVLYSIEKRYNGVAAIRLLAELTG